MSKQASSEDPRRSGAQLPFPEQTQSPPGSEAAMTPRPDYGLESYHGHQRLEGKVALITGGRVVAIPGDIGSPEHCRRLVEETVSAFGRLDILVNNAAYQMTYASLTEITPEDIEHTFRTNILAMFYLCQAAMPHMQSGSAIINTASIQAYQPSAQLLPYATTKGTIVTFTKGLAEEAIKHGVRVNAVAPGPVWTPLIPSTMPAEQTANFGKQTPVGRPAQPAELAPIFVFLACDESSYITGEVVGVTGGKPLS